MDRFDLDRHTIDFLYRLYKSGRINLEPPYQRGRVWKNEERYALIDSIREEFPIGLIMFNVVPHVDDDGIKTEKYDVVDGQQRMRTIFEYVDGVGWAVSERAENFEPFTKLTASRQTRFFEYKVPVASMKEFEQEEITECYSRLQRGKTLKMGEKLKAMTTYKAYRFLEELTSHPIFEIAGGAHKVRHSHWTLATAFFKSIYRNDLFGRQEYKHLSDFLRSNIDERKANKSLDQCRRFLNFEKKLIDEALRENEDFEKYARTPRTLKWIFVCLTKLLGAYGLSGREHLVAKGVLSYYKLIASENSPEWTAYLNTGRTGRIDTHEVRHCLVDLSNQIVIAAKADPLDTKRYFTQEQRELIFKNSGGQCQECEIQISPTNFHADHKKPYSAGGPTTVGNGRALCARCNRLKGASWKDLFEEPQSISVGN